MAGYNKDTDYQALINQAVAGGDYAAAARYEQQRNAKIADLDAAGTNTFGAKQTNLYSQYAGGNLTQSPNFTGSSNGVYTFDATQGGIKDQMNQNSKLWWDAYNSGDTAWMQSLEAANKSLAAMLGSGVTFDPHTGYWTGAADQQASQVQTPGVNLPAWSGGSASMPTWSGVSAVKPTWSGVSAVKPEWDGYDVEKPVYQSQYGAQIDAMLDQILNREEFSYDAESDPLYQQYKTQYTREGNRAMNDTMAAAAINAGGMNSYAMTAAQQANDYYMAQLADKIPELYQLAYSMYMDDLGQQRADLGMLQDQENIHYGQYRDQVSDWYNDRDFDYGQYRDQMSDYKDERNFEYGQYRDQMSDYYNDRDFEYGQYRDQVSDFMNNRDFEYGVHRDNVADSKWQTEFDYGVSRDQVADSRYENETAYERAMDMLLQGVMPSDTLLSQAGISGAEASAITGANAKTTKVSGGNNGKNDDGDDDDPKPKEPEKLPTYDDPNSKGLVVDMNSLDALGYGDLDEEQLYDLEARGFIESYVVGNRIMFRRTGLGGNGNGALELYETDYWKALQSNKK